jgi:putative oxidoreductase
MMPSFIATALRCAALLKQRLLPSLQDLALLSARLYLLKVFLTSGLTKLDDWESTLFLFTEEYQVPLLPPELAAWLGTGGELVFPVLLALGLMSRPAALGLFAVNAVAAISYPGLSDAGYQQHVLWGVLAAVLVLFGPGRVSLDAWWWPRAWLAHAHHDAAMAACAAASPERTAPSI